MARIIVGTAGHIDHGKSTLVRALTGTDPDRLPEEKKRGITVDLGYAFLGDVASIIDVPGHEKLIRNMVAGAATIDFALLVVAADDGLMPQTREHFDILRLLGVKQGCIVLTKCDTVDPDWLDLVEEQIQQFVKGTFLDDAPLFRVDSLSGRGIPELRESLIAILCALPIRADRGVFRLPIDRVFVVKGRGTVVTGTILSGHIERDTRLVALPGGFDVRAKRLESQGFEAEELVAGQRAALNLLGDTERIERGQTLTVPGSMVSSSRVKVIIEELPGIEPVKDRQRIRFLIGTQEAIGRVQLLKRDPLRRLYAHLLLEEEVVAAWGDYFVLRRYSPLETLGGGRVLEPLPPRFRSRDLAAEIDFALAADTADLNSALNVFLRYRGRFGIRLNDLAVSFALAPSDVERRCNDFTSDTAALRFGDTVLLRSRFDELRTELSRCLTELHRATPSAKGFSRADLRSGDLSSFPDSIFEEALLSLVTDGAALQDGPLYREPHRQVILSAAQRETIGKIQPILRAQRFAPPSAAVIAQDLNRPRAEIEKTLVTMEKIGYCRRLGLDLFFDAEVFDSGIEMIHSALSDSPELSVADAARLLSSSRKYVVPFLEFLDGKGITARSGNVRVRGRNFQAPQ